MAPVACISMDCDIYMASALCHKPEDNGRDFDTVLIAGFDSSSVNEQLNLKLYGTKGGPLRSRCQPDLILRCQLF